MSQIPKPYIDSKETTHIADIMTTTMETISTAHQAPTTAIIHIVDATAEDTRTAIIHIVDTTMTTMETISTAHQARTATIAITVTILEDLTLETICKFEIFL